MCVYYIAHTREDTRTLAGWLFVHSLCCLFILRLDNLMFNTSDNLIELADVVDMYFTVGVGTFA